MKKSLYDISLPITEEEYRNDGRIHYSTLAKYERTGFNGLETLFDRVDTPSLLFGSLVDEMITGTKESFNEKYLVAEFPAVPDSILPIVKRLFEMHSELYSYISDIPDNTVISLAAEYNYQNNWKPETRAKVIKEKGKDYYRLLYLAKGKTIVSSQDYHDACEAVKALRASPATKWYFEKDNPFDDIERLYQLKFAAEFDGIQYSCMMDLVVTDHKNKTIQPVDLKTSYKKEWDFYKSFVEWSYQIQNRLYFRILEDNIKKDPYFKDFKILPYKDIVVCKTSLIPLVWDCPFTFESGTLYFGKNKQIEMRDPFTIAKELQEYLEYEYITPIGITIEEPNNLEEWLNRL